MESNDTRKGKCFPKILFLVSTMKYIYILVTALTYIKLSSWNTLFFCSTFFGKPKVIHGSLGANIGLLENDRIISIDGRRCKTLEDVHLSLLNKSRCVITVKRTVIVEVSVFQKKCFVFVSQP